LKYGGPSPKIEIGAELRGEYVRFWVKDHGPGLSPAEQKGLFEQFNRLDQHREIEGVGLGLTLVREIIERLGGEVGVEGDRGIGCTFYFTLPAAGKLT
jgi:signal transduction histidine kinase